MHVPTISRLLLATLHCLLLAFRPRLAPLLVTLVIAFLPLRAQAHASGWASDGCSGCHKGGQAPTVSITTDVTTISPGQLVNLTVSVSATNGHGAGFFLESSTGKFSIVDSGTKIMGNGVTQNARRTGTGAATTFKVGWTAPVTPGGVDFYAWGNSVNGDGSSGGDRDGSAFSSVAYGCAGVKYYHDYDGDGVGAVSSGFTMGCPGSVPLYYSARGDDCNDNVPANFPGNPEICDGVDNDCNGQVDEALTFVTYCTDADGDGHGVTGKGTITDCAPKKGFGVCDNDCNDADVAIFPGHPDVCDGKDNNCNGQTDENLPVSTYCEDADGDGHGIAGGKTMMGCAKAAGFGACDNDCNDGLASVYVGATEICDGKDNNCNNQVDENAIVLCGTGWCAQAASGCNSTCTPGSPRDEQCNDFDDDCDGVADNGTDLQLCGAPGLHCAAGYCVPAEGGDAGAGGEAGASNEPVTSGAGGADDQPLPSGGGGLTTAGSPSTVNAGGAAATPAAAPKSAFACGFGLAPAQAPFAALGGLFALGLVLRRSRRR